MPKWRSKPSLWLSGKRSTLSFLATAAILQKMRSITCTFDCFCGKQLRDANCLWAEPNRTHFEVFRKLRVWKLLGKHCLVIVVWKPKQTLHISEGKIVQNAAEDSKAQNPNLTVSSQKVRVQAASKIHLDDNPTDTITSYIEDWSVVHPHRNIAWENLEKFTHIKTVFCTECLSNQVTREPHTADSSNVNTLINKSKCNKLDSKCFEKRKKWKRGFRQIRQDPKKLSLCPRRKKMQSERPLVNRTAKEIAIQAISWKLSNQQAQDRKLLKFCRIRQKIRPIK